MESRGPQSIEALPDFNAAVAAHQAVAYSLAYRIVGDRASAEDVVQEAFLKAYRSRASFRGGNLRGWMLRIVANAARDELRRRRRRPSWSLDAEREPGLTVADLVADDRPTPEAVAVQRDLRGALELALRELPPDWREVVVLADVHGLPYQEVAEVTGLPIGTVKSRISRARARLRDRLTETGDLRVSAAEAVAPPRVAAEAAAGD